MKTFFFMIVMLLASGKIFSQSNSIGIKSGATFSNVISKNFLTDNKQRIGIIEGVTYDYPFHEHFSIGIEACYEQRGFMNYFIFTDNNGNPTGRKEPFHYQYDYLSFPMKLNYCLGNKYFAFAGIGIVPAYAIKANLVTPVFDQNFVVIGKGNSNMLNNISRFDFGGLAEIGGGFTFKEKFSVNISFRYQRSFTSITNDHYFPTAKIWHIAMIPSIGIKYFFGGNDTSL
jgi:hypothetical protein